MKVKLSVAGSWPPKIKYKIFKKIYGLDGCNTEQLKQKNEILFIHIENDKNDLKAVIMLAINASPLRITYSLN